MNEITSLFGAIKKVGSMSMDTAELILMSRKVDKSRRREIASYIDAWKEKNGEVQNAEQWDSLYTELKKMLSR